MSFKGKMFHVMLKNRHLLKGHLRREVIDENTSIEKDRRETEIMADRLVKKIEGVTYKKADFGAFYAEWVHLKNAPEDKAVLYFHGGGFVKGSVKAHRNIVGNFVKHLGVNALVFDYRLAPEHPAPAAVYDAVAIYTWLLDQGYKAENVAFVGDSSGGGIELAAMIKCKDDGLPLPAVCAAFSPCTDMTLSGESHKTRAKADPCTPKGANETYLSYYVGKGDPKHPYASPLFGDLQGLPPIIIQVGNDETLRDDSVRFAEKAEQAGVEVKIKVWKGMFHCFPLLAPMFPEATDALNETCAFLREKLNITS
ncbi:MAG: alpha/beta hydrolase [Clostridia bacterium]|nr:alpha/beta hydrolase [Clostridia bacterium]